MARIYINVLSIVLQVRLINAPEVMSKFLGESEKNLRSVEKC